MGKRSGRRTGGDARLRVVQGGETARGKRGTTAPGDALQPLVLELRRRMRSTNPWDLLAFMSTLALVADGRPGPDGQPLAINGLVESFIGVDLAETTAALSALAVLVQDEPLAAEIREELDHRSQPMPIWLRDIGETRVTRAAIMSELSGVGDDIVLGIEWAGGGEGTFLTYVDHAAGTVVKDAFPSPASIGDTVDRMGSLMAADEREDEVELEPLDLDEARELLEEALDIGDTTGVEFETDTWPSSRPILQWLISLLPEPEYTEADLEELEELEDLDELDGLNEIDAFARALQEERAEVMEAFAESDAARKARVTLTGNGTDDAVLSIIVGSGTFMSDEDFLDWTPERVEGLLLFSIPASVLVERRIAKRVPELMEAFAVWALEETDAPKARITKVRKAIERVGPEYVAIATSREASFLRDAIRAYGERAGLPEVGMPILESDDPLDFDELMLDYRAKEVGGLANLKRVDAKPLPDEPFDWSTVAEDVREPVGEVLRLLDDFADRRFGVEFRTACRRVLAAVVAADPALFRRRASAASSAAVVAWLVGRSNSLVTYGSDSMPAGELWADFGLKGASTRADTFRRVLGIDSYDLGHSLGRAEWLISEARASLVKARAKAGGN